MVIVDRMMAGFRVAELMSRSAALMKDASRMLMSERKVITDMKRGRRFGPHTSKSIERRAAMLM